MRYLASITMAGFLMSITATAAVAQQPTADQVQMAYNAARNQLGVLKYCQDKGYGDADAVALQTKMIGLLPPPADTSKGDAAEAQGKQGKVSAMGMEQDIATAAKAQNSTEEQLCQRLVGAIKQAGAALPK